MINQLGNPVVYLCLRLLLITILLYSGWLITFKDKSKKYFWWYALPSIITYSLIQGLRWQRGIDYPHYYQDLQGNLYSDYKEPIYLLWIDLFQSTGLDPSVGFVLYSLLLIISFFCVIQKYPRSAVWALPLFLIMTCLSSENIIRQYLAITFLMFAYAAYLNNSKKWMFVSLIVVPLIHYSGMFAVFIFLGCIYLPKFFPVIKDQPKYAYFFVSAYILLFYFWDISYFENFSGWLSSITFSEDTLGYSYLNRADRYFSAEGSISEVLGLKTGKGVSFINQTTLFLSNALTIWFGYKYMCVDVRTKVLFWFTYLAIIIRTIGGDIEMYSRLYNWLVYFVPILSGIIIIQYKFKQEWIRIFIITVFLINYGFFGLRQLIFPGLFGCAFIWDK